MFFEITLSRRVKSCYLAKLHLENKELNFVRSGTRSGINVMSVLERGFVITGHPACSLAGAQVFEEVRVEKSPMLSLPSR